LIFIRFPRKKNKLEIREEKWLYGLKGDFNCEQQQEGISDSFSADRVREYKRLNSSYIFPEFI
jgi:hypothetical protein